MPEHEIPDVSQDVFAAVASSLGTFRSDRAGTTFRAWMRGIARATSGSAAQAAAMAARLRQMRPSDWVITVGQSAVTPRRQSARTSRAIVSGLTSGALASWPP